MKVGLEYKLGEQDCFSLIKEELNNPIFNKAKESLSGYKKLKEYLNNNYKVTSSPKAGDLAIFTRKNQKNFSHIGLMVDKYLCFHNEDTKLGSKVEPVSKICFCGLNVLYLRKKED